MLESPFNIVGALQTCTFLHGLSFFENLMGAQGSGGGASRPVVKQHAVSQKMLAHFTWSFVHILYWQYGKALIKKLTNVTFVIIWWRHHESHVLTFLKFFRNWCIFLVKWICKIHRKQVAENNSKKLIIILQYKKIFQKLKHFNYRIKIYRNSNFIRITCVKKWCRQQ